MNIRIKSVLDIAKDVLALGLFEEDVGMLKTQNPELARELADALSTKRFEHVFGKTYHTKISDSTYRRILVVSLGKKPDFTYDKIRRAMSLIVNDLKSTRFTSATTNIPALALDLNYAEKMVGQCVAEGLILSEYAFDRYLSNDRKQQELTVVVTHATDAGLALFNEGIRIGACIAHATNEAKNLVNEPANVVTPVYLEKVTRTLFSRNPKIKITVLARKELEKLGMNLLLSVGKGSAHEPRLIIIEYRGSFGRPTAIIGKGITFDSGGYDVKPSGGFADMKADMAGAAAVIETVNVLATLNAKKHVIAVIPTCENMVDAHAYKPGDIIRAYNGKTVEIGNTDAEGRLVLADAIAYVEKKYQPERIIDLATLTGAIVIALGFYTSGLFSNDEQLQQQLIEAGNISHDRVWPMPFYDDYHDLMDGTISDLRNMSRWTAYKAAGAITGAVFLSKFVEKAKWAHIDIAGTAMLEEAKDYRQKSGSGAGVRLLSYYFLKE